MTQRLRVARGRSILEDDAASHNRLHPGLEPVAEIEPGEEIVVECRDGMDGAFARARTSRDLVDVDLDANHPLTGPIAVRGAEPGDVLVVETLDIEPDGTGGTAVIPGFGLLGDRFAEPFLVRWEIARGVARSEELPGVSIAGRPFLGCMAVAPSHELLARATEREAGLAARGGFVLEPGRAGAAPAREPIASRGLRTIPPRENGGNLDIRHLTAGSRLLLPVGMPGALLSLGDPHFAQGDGELCGTAIEMGGVATVRVSLRRAADLRWRPRFPAFEHVEEPAPRSRRWFVTTGIPVDEAGENADMDVGLAARRALEELVDWLEAERGLRPEQGYVLAGVAADLRISEIVNVPNALVSAHLPLDVFDDERAG